MYVSYRYHRVRLNQPRLFQNGSFASATLSRMNTLPRGNITSRQLYKTWCVRSCHQIIQFVNRLVTHHSEYTSQIEFFFSSWYITSFKRFRYVQTPIFTAKNRLIKLNITLYSVRFYELKILVAFDVSLRDLLDNSYILTIKFKNKVLKPIANQTYCYRPGSFLSKFQVYLHNMYKCETFVSNFQARHSLKVLSEVTGKNIHALMEPHKALLEDMIPPKKHLLRHQPVNTQIALMDGNTFCTSLSPRLFTMDLSVVEHKVFFTEVSKLFD